MNTESFCRKCLSFKCSEGNVTLIGLMHHLWYLFATKVVLHLSLTQALIDLALDST